MLRYLLPSGVIVAVCIAIYGTSLNVSPVQDESRAVSVVFEPVPSAAAPREAQPAAPTEPAVTPAAPAETAIAAPWCQDCTPKNPSPGNEEPAPQPPEPEPAPAPRLSRTPIAPSTPSRRPRPVEEHPAPHAQRTPSPVQEAQRPPSIEDQLMSARTALGNNNLSLARGLLESAETAIVFQPSEHQQTGTSAAAARITEALRELNAGNQDQAMRYLGQALATVRPGRGF